MTAILLLLAFIRTPVIPPKNRPFNFPPAPHKTWQQYHDYKHQQEQTEAYRWYNKLP